MKTLKSVNDDRVRAYVVWMPIFGGNFKGAAQELSNSFPDRRASYFLDPESLTGNLWERILKTERGIAWDVYFLYGPDAKWGQEPPPPDFWMHQLMGVTKAPTLNEQEFTAKLREILSQISAPTTNQSHNGRDKVKVEFLYFQSCPAHKQALANLRAALKESRTQADLVLINVTSEEQAERVRFQGSPSIRVNGRDLDGRDEGFSYSCRVYQVGSKITATPTKEYIKDKLGQLLR